MSVRAADATDEQAARTLAAGFRSARLGSGALVVTAYSAAAKAELEELGYVASEHARFPGRREPEVMWECVWHPQTELEAEV